jgi:DNA-binding response OmpR family regulator
MRSKVKILVVENETTLAMMMAYLLSCVGCEVQSAFNGRDGLEQATTRIYDLILLDVSLPDLNGFDMCRELKQRHISYRTPIILISGNSVEERRSKAYEIGAADFIAKPFEAEDFVSRVLRHAEKENLHEFQMQDAAKAGENFTQSLLVE